MLQNTRDRLVASGLGVPTALEALVFAPWMEATAELDPHRGVPAARRADRESGAESANTPLNTWVPAVDVEEGEDALRLAIEVPGVDPNALAITLDDRVLTVSGERTVARREGARGRSAYRLERRYGRFARSMTLPTTVDPDRINARYEHGVLHLEIPKRPEAQPRRIAISTPEAASQPASQPASQDAPDGGQHQIASGDPTLQ